MTAAFYVSRQSEIKRRDSRHFLMYYLNVYN